MLCLCDYFTHVACFALNRPTFHRRDFACRVLSITVRSIGTRHGTETDRLQFFVLLTICSALITTFRYVPFARLYSPSKPR